MHRRHPHHGGTGLVALMSKLPTHEAMVAVILGTWNSVDSDTKRVGRLWYYDAWRSAVVMADKHGVSIEQAAGVIAALSPRCPWKRNLIDAEAVLTRGVAAVVSSFGRNKTRAVAIANGHNPDHILGGPKVRAFWRCLVSFRNRTHVCIDVWAARAVGYYGRISPQVYRRIAAAYLDAARRLNVTPCELQATLWIDIRGTAK
jgi:hypothetical protein